MTRESSYSRKGYYHKYRAGSYRSIQETASRRAPTLETAQAQIDNLFFDPHRYDLSRVGRYKYNKKLAISARIAGFKADEPIISNLTGEILAEPGETITPELAYRIEQEALIPPL